MATSFGALCTDFYVNQKLSLKLDLPSERETVLHFFDSVRKSAPGMSKFRRFEGELSLESARLDGAYQWLALRRTSVRSGVVNPDTMAEAGALHRLVLQTSPFHLTLSPLDVDCVELMFGFDLECEANHDEVVHDALFAGTPLGALTDIEGTKLRDVQPIFGITIDDQEHGLGDVQASFEVKTRERSKRGSVRASRDEPISLFLAVRKHGPFTNLDDLPKVHDALLAIAERLATERVVPDLLTPIAQHITPRSA